MPDDLYHRDILAWSQAQAERLRRLAAGERVNDLDWANIIEEIESVGRSEMRAVKSLLLQALVHAMKVAAWPEHRSADKWRNEIKIFLVNARDDFAPSMGRLLDVQAIHANALESVRAMRMTIPTAPLAERMDLTLDDLLSRELTPDALIAHMRQPTGGS